MDGPGLEERATPVSRVGALFDAQRLARAAWAFTTRRIPREQPFTIDRQAAAPRAGDLVLARVDVLGYHRGLQLCDGRKRTLFPGDEIVVAYGNRYAANQFEAGVPRTLGPCQLVASGGVAGKVLSWHARLAKGATLITPVGLLLRADGGRANLGDYAIERIDTMTAPSPPVIAVVGTGMDAGKTTAAAFLVRGLTQAGLRVGYAKITGTGAGGDTWLLRDAGADPVLDFTDAGHASTYRVALPELVSTLVTLVAHLAASGVDTVVLEVADGVLQTETAAILESPAFKAIVGGVFFASGDAMGAVAGAGWLEKRGLAIAGLGGLMTASPLQVAEASSATGLPVYSSDDLGQAPVARAIIARVKKFRMISGGSHAGSDGTQDERGFAAQA